MESIPMIAYVYGNPTMSMLRVYLTQGLEFPGITSSAMRSGSAQICEISMTKNLLLIFSEYQVQKRSCKSVSTEPGITRRLVSKVPKPRLLSVNVK